MTDGDSGRPGDHSTGCFGLRGLIMSTNAEVKFRTITV